MPDPDSLAARALRAIDAIEVELRRLGVWQSEPPPPEALEITQAFGADKLTFFQWLQFVLVPRVREIASGDGDFPKASRITRYAVRALDGYDDTDDLVDRLAEFDALFAGPPRHFDHVDHTGSVSSYGVEPAESGTEGSIGDAIFPVRGYVIGIQVGMPHASRAHLTRPHRDDATFVPRAPFVIDDFHTGLLTRREDHVLVPLHVEGVRPDGSRGVRHASVVVVREDDAWRIDVARTGDAEVIEDEFWGPRGSSAGS